MTREEAIRLLQATRMMLLGKDNQPVSDLYEALEMAISALSQQPCETSTDEPMTMVYPTIFCDDAISREAVINEIQHAEINFTITSKVDFSEYKKEIQEIIDHIVEAQINAVNKLPSVQPSRKVIEDIKAEIADLMSHDDYMVDGMNVIEIIDERTSGDMRGAE